MQSDDHWLAPVRIRSFQQESRNALTGFHSNGKLKYGQSIRGVHFGHFFIRRDAWAIDEFQKILTGIGSGS